jgi:hypothetical protein
MSVSERAFAGLPLPVRDAAGRNQSLSPSTHLPE